MTKFTVELSDISRVIADGETNARVMVSIKEWREHNLIGEISLEVVVAAEDALTLRELERAALERAILLMKEAGALTVDQMLQSLDEERREADPAKFGG